jgi:hypothetical protein
MIKKISLILFLSVFFICCDVASITTTNCPAIIGVSATAVVGPTEADIDESILLEVSYKTKKNCGVFNAFFDNSFPSTLIDVVTVNVLYDACACDEMETVEKTNYTFNKSEAGVYVVRFKKTNDTFVEHTVTVE